MKIKTVCCLLILFGILRFQLSAQKLDVKKGIVNLQLKLSDCCNYMDGLLIKKNTVCLLNLNKDSLHISILDNKSKKVFNKYSFPTGNNLKLKTPEKGKAIEEEWELIIGEKSRSFLTISTFKKYYIVDFTLLLNMGNPKKTVINSSGHFYDF
jgi:hypothetical protein